MRPSSQRPLVSPNKPTNYKMVNSLGPMDIWVGRRIDVRLRQLGLSQRYLGEKLGVNSAQVYRWCAGRNRIPIQKLYEASRIMRLPPGWFFEGSEQLEISGGAPESDVLNEMLTPETIEVIHEYVQLTGPARAHVRRAMQLLPKEGPNGQEIAS